MGGDLSKEMSSAVLEAGSLWDTKSAALFDKFRGKKEILEGEGLLKFWATFGKCMKLEYSAETVKATYMAEADKDRDGRLSLAEMRAFLRSKYGDFDKKKVR